MRSSLRADTVFYMIYTVFLYPTPGNALFVGSSVTFTFTPSDANAHTQACALDFGSHGPKGAMDEVKEARRAAN